MRLWNLIKIICQTICIGKQILSFIFYPRKVCSTAALQIVGENNYCSHRLVCFLLFNFYLSDFLITEISLILKYVKYRFVMSIGGCSVSRDEKVVSRAIDLNEQLQRVLARHDALISSRSTSTSNDYVLDEAEEEEEEAEQLVRRYACSYWAILCGGYNIVLCSLYSFSFSD